METNSENETVVERPVQPPSKDLRKKRKRRSDVPVYNSPYKSLQPPQAINQTRVEVGHSEAEEMPCETTYTMMIPKLPLSALDVPGPLQELSIPAIRRNKRLVHHCK